MRNPEPPISVLVQVVQKNDTIKPIWVYNECSIVIVSSNVSTENGILLYFPLVVEHAFYFLKRKG